MIFLSYLECLHLTFPEVFADGFHPVEKTFTVNEGTITNLNIQLVPVGFVSSINVIDDDEVLIQTNDLSNDTSSFNVETSFMPYFVPDPNYQSIDTPTNDTLTVTMKSTNSSNVTNHQSSELIVLVGAFDVVRRFFNQFFV